jgi:hypothetical protein
VTDPPPSTNDLEIALIVQSAILPVISLMIGVFARQLGRRDGDESPRPNDWAAATSVLLMTFGKVAGDMIEAIRKGHDKDALNTMWWTLGLLIVAFLSIKRDRYDSWVIVEGKPSKLKRRWGGIIIPNVVAVGVFAVYQYFKLRDVVP